MSLSTGLAILTAVVAGLLIGTQAPLTSLLRQKLGLWGMAAGVHIPGCGNTAESAAGVADEKTSFFLSLYLSILLPVNFL